MGLLCQCGPSRHFPARQGRVEFPVGSSPEGEDGSWADARLCSVCTAVTPEGARAFAVAAPASLLLSRWCPALRNPPGSPFHLPPLGKPLPAPLSSAPTRGSGHGGWRICILGCGILAKSFYLSEPQLYACLCREPSCGPDGQPRSMFCAKTKKFLRPFLKVWALAGILIFLSCWMRKGLDFRSVQG